MNYLLIDYLQLTIVLNLLAKSLNHPSHRSVSRPIFCQRKVLSPYCRIVVLQNHPFAVSSVVETASLKRSIPIFDAAYQK